MYLDINLYLYKNIYNDIKLITLMKNCLLVNLKKFLCISLFVLIAITLNAQMIETIDFSLPGHTYNTYVNGINNRGDVCGYYTLSTGVNVGFIITGHGKRI